MSAGYTFSAAYVKSFEADMITYGEFENLLGCSKSQLAAFMQNRGYIGADIRDMLENEQQKTLGICTELCDGDRLSDIFGAERVFHNIQTVIKAVMSQNSWRELVYDPSSPDCEKLAEALKSGDFSETSLPDVCLSAADIYKKHGCLKAEMFLRRQYLEYISSAAEGNSFARGWTDLKILCEDLKIIFANRNTSPEELEEMLIPCSLTDVYLLAHSEKRADFILREFGCAKDYVSFENAPATAEKMLDDMIMKYLKNAHNDFFSFAPVLGYFEGKRTEMINLRLVACSIGNRTDKQKIAERLRETYV